MAIDRFPGDRIKRMRMKLGLTQGGLAHKLGITAAGVGRWERLEGNPEPENLKKLAVLFGCSVEFLLDGTEPQGETSTGNDPANDDNPTFLDAVDLARQAFAKQCGVSPDWVEITVRLVIPAGERKAA